MGVPPSRKNYFVTGFGRKVEVKVLGDRKILLFPHGFPPVPLPLSLAMGIEEREG